MLKSELEKLWQKSLEEARNSVNANAPKDPIEVFVDNIAEDLLDKATFSYTKNLIKSYFGKEERESLIVCGDSGTILTASRCYLLDANNMTEKEWKEFDKSETDSEVIHFAKEVGRSIR